MTAEAGKTEAGITEASYIDSVSADARVEELSQTIRAALVVRALGSLHFLVPIWVAFGTDELGLTVFETSALFMVWIGTILLFEVPGGAFADRFGRKRMLVWGSLLIAAGPLAYSLKVPIWILILANIVSGIGMAISSGTLSPIVRQLMKSHDSNDSRVQALFDRYLSQDGAVLHSARIFAFATAGVLYTLNPVLPFVGVIIATCTSAVVAQLFISDPGVEDASSSTWAHILEAARLLAGYRTIAIGFGLFTVANLVMEQYWSGYQPFFFDRSVSETTVGLIFSAIAGMSVVGALASDRLMKRFGVNTVLLIKFVPLLFLSVSFVQPIVAVQAAAAIAAGFFSGVATIPLVSSIQNTIETKFHSAAISFVSLAEIGTYVIGTLLVGAQIDWFEVDRTQWSLAGLSAIAAVIGLFLWASERQAESDSTNF